MPSRFLPSRQFRTSRQFRNGAFIEVELDYYFLQNRQSPGKFLF